MHESGDNIIAEDLEPDIITKNKGKLFHFRRLGFFLVSWKRREYVTQQKKLLIYYLIWYLLEIGCFALAFFFKLIFKNKDEKDRIDDFIEASFAVILIGILPSFWIYLLRDYNINLPQILMTANELEKTETYKKLQFSKNPIISYRQGWLINDLNVIDDEENKKKQNFVKNKLWLRMLVKYGPFIGIIVSVAACLILILCNFMHIIYRIIVLPIALEHLKQELPFFIMSVLYPIPYYISIWFCIFFLEWQIKIYESIKYLIINIRKSSSFENSRGETKLTEENKEVFDKNKLTKEYKKDLEGTKLKEKDKSELDSNKLTEECKNELEGTKENGKDNDGFESIKLTEDYKNELEGTKLAGKHKPELESNKLTEDYKNEVEYTKLKGKHKAELESIKLTKEYKNELESIACILNKVQNVFKLLNKKIFQKTIVIAFSMFMLWGVFSVWKVFQTSANFPYIVPFSLSIGHLYLACKWSNDLMKEYHETTEVLNEMHEEDVVNIRKELNKGPPQVLAFGGFSVNYSMMTAVVAFIISCIGIPEDVWPGGDAKQQCSQYNATIGEWDHTLFIKNNISIRINKTHCFKNQNDSISIQNC